jgi:predicted aspartyl protease
MPTWTGFLDSTGSPRIKISLRGWYEGVHRELDAVVDTGFTGFLSMPLVEAFPLGLILSGTAITILADGSQSFKLTALGEVFVGEESQRGVVLLDSGPSDVLVGMEFLKVFKKSLFVHEQIVSLIDTEQIKQGAAKAEKPTDDQAPPEAAPAPSEPPPNPSV